VCEEPKCSTTTGDSLKLLLIKFFAQRITKHKTGWLSPMTKVMVTRGMGNMWDWNRGRRAGEQVSGAGWGSSHTHCLYMGSDTGRGDGEHVVKQPQASTPSSHRNRQAETRKRVGSICGQGQKAEVFSGDTTRQEVRRQAGSVKGNQTEECWRVLHEKHT